jgi:hypothetical protein
MSGYQKRIWRALAVQGAGILVAVPAMLILFNRAPRLPLAALLVGLILAGAVILATGQPWWRRIDEMEREEHAIAWYEGSIPGALIALLCMAGVAAHTHAHREFALGASFCFLAQGVFYLIVWAVRRLGRRAREIAQ